jgi:hypothetical protein
VRLTPAEVTAIRASGLTDTEMARRLRRTVKTIHRARRGLTHSLLPIAPDTTPRDGTGRRTHGGPVRAKPARQRWSYFRE